MPPARSRPTGDGWSEYRQLVLNELERLDTIVTRLADQSHDARSSISKEISQCREQILSQLHDHIIRHMKAINDTKDDIDTSMTEKLGNISASSSKSLERFQQTMENLAKDMERLRGDVTSIKITAGVIGTIASVVVAFGTALIKIFWN